MADFPTQPRIATVSRSHIADLIRIGEETKLSPWSADSYLAEMRNAAAIMLRLVSDENETIGFVVGRLVIGGQIEMETDAEIYNIALTAAYQRRGLGQRLLDNFITKATAAGAKNVWLEVRESNQNAIKFYHKNGFAEVQTRANFYSDPRENALLMRLTLPLQKS